MLLFLQYLFRKNSIIFSTQFFSMFVSLDYSQVLLRAALSPVLKIPNDLSSFPENRLCFNFLEFTILTGLHNYRDQLLFLRFKFQGYKNHHIIQEFIAEICFFYAWTSIPIVTYKLVCVYVNIRFNAISTISCIVYVYFFTYSPISFSSQPLP